MPFNEDGSRKAAYKKSGFKMKASGYGNNPMKKNFPSAFKQDDEVVKYSDLPSDQVEAAKAWNMSTYGTHNPTAEAKKRSMTKSELAKFHKDNMEYSKAYEQKTKKGSKKKGVGHSLNPATIMSQGDGTGVDDVAKARKRAPHRYHGMSDARVKEILAKSYAKAKKRDAKIKNMKKKGTNPNQT